MKALLLLLAVATAAAALPPGLYGVTGDGNLTTARVGLDGSVQVLASTAAGVAIASSLVTSPTAAGVAFALALSTDNRQNMTLLRIDLASAAVTRRYAVPLPCNTVVGLGNEVAYSPEDGKVIVMGSTNTSDPTAPHRVGTIDVTTGAWAPLADVPADRLWTFLGNFAAYSPLSRTVVFQLRNYTTAGQAAVFVHVDTGKVTIRAGCETSNMGYDPAHDAFVTVGTFRNGTSIADVWRAQMSMPADGSADCATGRVLYSEAYAPSGEDVVSVGAFDAATRQYAYYGGDFATGTLGLMLLDWDSGVVAGPALPTGGPLPDTLLFVPPA